MSHLAKQDYQKGTHTTSTSYFTKPQIEQDYQKVERTAIMLHLPKLDYQKVTHTGPLFTLYKATDRT